MKNIICILLICMSYQVQAQRTLGFSIGHMNIKGQMDSRGITANSGTFSARLPLIKLFHLEGNIGYGSVAETMQHQINLNPFSQVRDQVFTSFEGQYWLPNSKSNYGFGDINLQIILPLFKNKVRFMAGSGVGFSYSKVYINLYDNNYEPLVSPVFTTGPIDMNSLSAEYTNGSYETELEDRNKSNIYFATKVGIEWSISYNLWLSVSMTSHISNSKELDAVKGYDHSLAGPLICFVPSESPNDRVNLFNLGVVKAF